MLYTTTGGLVGWGGGVEETQLRLRSAREDTCSGWDLAEFGNKAELSQLELELGLNLILEDFPWVEQKYNAPMLSFSFSCIAELELDNNINGF